MLEQGVYIGETRNCLYSTAHTDADADFIFDAVERSVSQMREGGFLGEIAELEHAITNHRDAGIASAVEDEGYPVAARTH